MTTVNCPMLACVHNKEGTCNKEEIFITEVEAGSEVYDCRDFASKYTAARNTGV